MTTSHLTAILTSHIKATGVPGLRVRPKAVASFFGVSHSQACLAVRRLQRRGIIVCGRTI